MNKTIKTITVQGTRWTVTMGERMLVGVCKQPGIVVEGRDMDDLLSCIHEALALIKADKENPSC